MSTKKSSKAPRKVSDKEAAESLQNRAVAEGRVVPTPRSAPKVAAVDIAGEKRRIAAESAQQKNLREAYQAQEAATKGRQEQGKRAATAQKKAGPPDPRFGKVNIPVASEPGRVFTVDNPTDDYLEFTFRGETIILKPGSNEFGDNYLPGVTGEDIASQAANFFGFSHGVKSTEKAGKKGATAPGDEITVPETTAGAVAFPDVLRDEIAAVSSPSADERAQPFRFPANTEHDPQGVKTRATKDALVDLHNQSTGKKSARVTGAKR